MASAAVKRGHKTLTIEQKLELLDKIGKKTYTVLCEEYGIGRSTISGIKKQESSLRQYKRKMTDMGVKRPAKVMKLGKDENLETALFVWFKQKREEGIPITGAIMQAKARDLHKRLSEARSDGAVQEFTADSCIAWLQQQDEASAYNMSVLHNLRELAAGKRLTSIKQKKLTDYLSV